MAKRLTALALAMMLGTSMSASAAVGVVAEPWLLDQMLQAREAGNRHVEADALSRLMMMDSDNADYQLHWLRMQLEETIREKSAIEAMIKRMCQNESAWGCRQARLMMANDSVQRRQALARVKLLETAGQYAMALEAMDAAFGGVPQEVGQRLYYYQLMLKVKGRTRQAEDGLKALLKANPEANLLARQLHKVLDDGKIDRLSDFGLEHVYSSGKRGQAISALKEALKLAPNDPRVQRWRHALQEGEFWYALDRGDAALELGHYDRATALYRQALTFDDKSPYPYMGLAQVAQERAQWDVAIRYTEIALSLASRENPSEVARIRQKLHNVRIRPTIEKARALADNQEYAQALRVIDSVKTDDAYHLWLKAQWAELAGDRARAMTEWRRLFKVKSYRQEARIAVARLLIEEGNNQEAKRLLADVTRPRQTLSISEVREVALLYQTLGMKDEAKALLSRYAKTRSLSGNALEMASLKHDLARLFAESGNSAVALDHYRQAFVDAKLVAGDPADDETFTRTMRTPDHEEPWDRQSLRTEAADLYQKDNVWVTTAVKYDRDSGTPGYSDMSTTVGMVELNTRLAGGILTLRGETVRMDVGDLPKNPNGMKFGICYSASCDKGTNTSETGHAMAIAWQGDHWGFDIGTTPQGFEYVDWVGGLEWDFDMGDVGASIEVYRRAKDSSLLALGGQRDPATGVTWGGVRRTGAALNLSYDLGGAHGLWSKFSYESIEGDRVEDNRAWQWMGGYYHRLIARPNRETRIGTSMMYWSFDRDLSGYTFGQGGYYSPQTYVSASLMALDRGRKADWSWEVQGRLGLAYAKTDDSPLYPLGMPKTATGINDPYAIEKGESGVSLSYSIYGVVERRLNAHWVLGLTAGASKSEGYEPHYAMLYLRYSIKDWQGDLPMPPIVLEPYSKW